MSPHAWYTILTSQLFPVSVFYILCDCFVYTIIRQITWQGNNIPDLKLLLNGSLFYATKKKLYLDQKRRDNILLLWTSTATCTRYLSYTEATEKASLILWMVVLKACLLSLHWHFLQHSLVYTNQSEALITLEKIREAAQEIIYEWIWVTYSLIPTRMEVSLHCLFQAHAITVSLKMRTRHS